MYTGGLAFYDNDSLASLAGLDHVTVIQGDLAFQDMGGLLTLSNLINLTSIRGDLDIYHNDSLTNLTGLDNIDADSIINLFITDNYKLTNCAVQSICDYIVNPFGANTIYNNAVGCSWIKEVIEACATIGTESHAPEPELLIYPSPSSTEIIIETPTKGYLFILNLNGLELLQQEITGPTTTIDVSKLPAGVYPVKVVGEKGVQVGKIIKE